MLSQPETGDNRHTGYFWRQITTPDWTTPDGQNAWPRSSSGCLRRRGSDVRQPLGDLPGALGIVLAGPLAAADASFSWESSLSRDHAGDERAICADIRVTAGELPAAGSGGDGSGAGWC
jgi:hypothetical protein